MTTTNKAFIDAYNSSHRVGAGSLLAPPVYQPAEAEQSQVLTVDTDASGVETLEPCDVAPWATPHAQPAAPRTTPRRPLSQVQADELFGLTPSHRTPPTREWPDVCQQLVARAADRYDSILRQLPAGPTGVLVGVVGAGPRSGCTTTAICLVLRSSALGRRTTLVDGDIAGGQLAKTLGMDDHASWPEVLAAGQSIQNAILPADEVGIDLLLAGTDRLDEVAANACFRASLAAGVLRRQYERVIVDFGAATDAARLSIDLATAMGVDYLFATRTPAATDDDVQATIAALAESGLRLAGLIEAA